MTEWAWLAQAGAWVVFGILFAMGKIISRTQSDALIAYWKQRGDEWKAVADTNAAAADKARENMTKALEGMQTVEALLRGIEAEARERRRLDQGKVTS